MRFPAAALLLFLCVSPALANREGWANAQQKAQRLERRGEFAEATVWWEAAAETLETVSAPLSALGMKEAKEDHDDGAFAYWKRYGEEDAKLAAEAREKAKACEAKAGTIPGEIRATVRQFIDGWIVQYPEQYWNWGRFELQIESRRAAGDPIGALQIEARARARWAERYVSVCLPYWKGRDKQRLTDYSKLAYEQSQLSGQARDRAATLERDGWEVRLLRRAIREGSPEEQRTAVERLAIRRDLEGLRNALQCDDKEARERATRLLIAWNDLPALAHPPIGEAGKFFADTLAAAEELGSPDFCAARLAGLSDSDGKVRHACELPLTRLLGAGPADPDALRDHLETVLARRCPAGLDVEIFASPELSGTPVRQTWEDLDRDWGREAPADAIPADGWSMRASGFLVMKEEAVVELLVQCDDAIRVRIDGRDVLDEWAETREPLYRRAPLKLSRGWHSFVLEYSDREGVSTLRAWLAPGRDEVEPLGPHLRRSVPR